MSTSNHPPHYNQGSIECCDAMLSAYGSDAFSSFCVMNAMKYLWRYQEHEDGRLINLQKAVWYLDKAQKLI